MHWGGAAGGVGAAAGQPQADGEGVAHDHDQYLHTQEGIKEHLRIMERQLEIIKRRADMWKTDRDSDEHVVNIM